MVIQGLEEYRHHLEEYPYKVEIWSDHQNLTFFRTAQKLTRRQAIWAFFMTHFNFVLYHKPEKTMQAEDLLSRWADHEIGTDLDNTNQVLLKPEFFAINALETTHEMPINDKIILKEVKAALLSDKVTKDYKILLKSGPRELKNPCKTGTMRIDYSCTEGKFIFSTVWKTPCDNRSLRYTMICHLPDTQVSGRPMSWSPEITGGLGWQHLSRNILHVMICVSRWKIVHSNLLDHSCLTRRLTGLGK